MGVVGSVVLQALFELYRGVAGGALSGVLAGVAMCPDCDELHLEVGGGVGLRPRGTVPDRLPSEVRWWKRSLGAREAGPDLALVRCRPLGPGCRPSNG